MSEDKPREYAANIVVRHQEKPEFLVVQRSAHDSMPLKWEFPGGGMEEEDEDLEDTALRELEEETGIEPERLEKGDSGVVELEERFLEIHVFEAEVDERQVELGAEHRDFRWISKESIEKLDSNEGMRKDLEAIEEWDKKALK